MLNRKAIKYMSEDIAKKTIDFLIPQFNKKNISIVFTGGEPLLNFKVIKYVLNYIKKKYKNINFEFKLTTNGTILNKEIVEEIIKNNIKVIVSLDLPPSQHDYNRPFKNKKPSFKIIKHNLELLLRDIPATNILLRTTLPYNTKFTFRDIVTSFYRLKLPTENIAIETEFGKRISYSQICKLDDQKKLFIKYERNCLFNSGDTKVLYKKEIIGNILYTIISGKKAINECIPIESGITVNPIGEFYLCDVSVNKEEFYLGNIYSGFEERKIKDLEKKYYNDCSSCWAVSFCGKFCFLIRNNKNILSKNCCRLKNDFINDLHFFLNLNCKQIKKLILSAVYFTRDKNYIASHSKNIDFFLGIYKFLNQNNKYIKPVNLLPY
ncbi:MAG: radical SAM protein [Candidatus Omnitrophica bacterium]|nr:radical SAM protein [Candidatus Omnitrophota bacterium]